MCQACRDRAQARTGRNGKVVDFYLYLAAALVTIRQLIPRPRALPLAVGRPSSGSSDIYCQAL
jgi:hypothetical protein